MWPNVEPYRLIIKDTEILASLKGADEVHGFSGSTFKVFSVDALAIKDDVIEKRRNNRNTGGLE